MVKKKAKSKSLKHSNSTKASCIATTINNEVIAEALNSVNQPVLLKVCRLCESKDGPFLNIFDPDKVTAKKIEDLMPFVITENDDLPHKICFRCSAKVVELHEFIQKCINTQNNLRKAANEKDSVPLKTKTRKLWEQKLNKSNMSNDDICDALIKKAMESIKDIPLTPVPDEEMPIIQSKSDRSAKPGSSKKEDKANPVADDVLTKDLRLSVDKCDEKRTRLLRNKKTTSTPEEPKNTIAPLVDTSKSLKVIQQRIRDSKLSSDSDINIEEKETNPSCDSVKITPNKESEPKPEELSPKFNIMDHVSKITVNGVGILFQCKLCNRNFLKKEVVLSHDCAKKGKPKVDFTKHIVVPEPPKAPTVKYIKMDEDFRKTVIKSSNDKVNAVSESVTKKGETVDKTPAAKTKPKIGPASRVKRNVDNLSNSIGMTVRQREPTPEPNPSTTSVPINPNLTLMPPVMIPGLQNTSFKLVLGPHNTLTLVADKGNDSVPTEQEVPQQKIVGKRKSEDQIKKLEKTKAAKSSDSLHRSSSRKSSSPEIADNTPSLQSRPNQPYPVGLFQTVSHHSSIYVPPAAPENPPFTTPAMKKQSYKVVQTGHPSKLLISTKAQGEDEPSKKRSRKTKHDVKTDAQATPPYSVTLEDATHQKDAGFFTFINVDPLLQPSYVLPTDNIIQESQISTSTPVERNAADVKDSKDKYSCNMCNERFSREKKLLSHIQSHFLKMDQEDQEREKSKRKGKK